MFWSWFTTTWLWITAVRPQLYVYHDLPRHLNAIPALDECKWDMYAIEWMWPRFALEFGNKFNWQSSNAKQYYIVPHDATALYHRCIKTSNITTCKEKAASHIRNILDYIQLAYPYWNASQGHDHVLVWGWDLGAKLIKDDEELYEIIHATVRLTVADLPNSVTLMPFVHKKRNNVTLSKDFKRTGFAFFGGTVLDNKNYSEGIRPELVKLSQRYPIHYTVLIGHYSNYTDLIQQHLYALCPPGWSSWTPRPFEAIQLGTLPVLLSHTLLPFENLVPYDSFIIRTNMTLVHEQLRNITKEEWHSKWTLMNSLAHHFRYHWPPQPLDAFDGSLIALQNAN